MFIAGLKGGALSQPFNLSPYQKASLVSLVMKIYYRYVTLYKLHDDKQLRKIQNSPLFFPKYIIR